MLVYDHRHLKKGRRVRNRDSIEEVLCFEVVAVAVILIKGDGGSTSGV